MQLSQCESNSRSTCGHPIAIYRASNHTGSAQIMQNSVGHTPSHRILVWSVLNCSSTRSSCLIHWKTCWTAPNHGRKRLWLLDHPRACSTPSDNTKTTCCAPYTTIDCAGPWNSAKHHAEGDSRSVAWAWVAKCAHPHACPPRPCMHAVRAALAIRPMPAS